MAFPNDELVAYIDIEFPLTSYSQATQDNLLALSGLTNVTYPETFYTIALANPAPSDIDALLLDRIKTTNYGNGPKDLQLKVFALANYAATLAWTQGLTPGVGPWPAGTKFFIGNLFQDSTNPPTLQDVAKNDFSIANSDFAYTSSGVFTVTKTGQFTANKTFCFMANPKSMANRAKAVRTSNNVVTIGTYTQSVLVGAAGATPVTVVSNDGVMDGTLLFIAVIP